MCKQACYYTYPEHVKGMLQSECTNIFIFFLKEDKYRDILSFFVNLIHWDCV